MINEMKHDKMFHIDVIFLFKTSFMVNALSHFFHTFSFFVIYSFPSSDFKFRVPGENWKISSNQDCSFSLSHEKIVRRIKVLLTMLHSFVQSEFWEHILFSLYFHKIYLIYSILRIPLMWSVNGAQYKNISFFFFFFIRDKMFPFLRHIKSHCIALHES